MGEAQFDVAIIGAGPVGCALALALQHMDLSVALVERARPPAPKEPGTTAVRAIALSYASRLILERIGAWSSLPNTPIQQIHVSQSGGFGRTTISCADLELPALGYVAAYQDIAPHLAARLDASAISRVQSETPPRARLLVHAEGATGPNAIERDYRHVAIIAKIEADRPAHGVAWERFTAQGPLALLPMGRDYAMVWSQLPGQGEALLQMPEDRFLAQLQAAFGTRAGHFSAVGVRAASPLVLRYRSARAAPGEIHIGNAAQTLHPVAGQGLNLGLRDAWDLAELLREMPREQLGGSALAQRYARLRRLDARTTIHMTDLLATLYVRRDPLSSALRGAALAAFDLLPHARRALARGMIYGARIG